MRVSEEKKASEEKKEPLDDEVQKIVEEARMILPGIQALFGFQLIAVFNQRFAESLPAHGQLLHLLCLFLVAISIALIMAPAAYHRQAERGTVSRYFADYASRLIALAMLPLLISIPLEVAIVSFVISSSLSVSVALAAILLVLFAWLWFIFPARKRRHRK